MPISSQANILAHTRIPQPSIPNTGVQPRKKVAPPPLPPKATPTAMPHPNGTVVIRPRNERRSAAIQTSLIVGAPASPELGNEALPRRSAAIQTSVVVEEPISMCAEEDDEFRCMLCDTAKYLKTPEALKYHIQYEHDRDFRCPIPGCITTKYVSWNSLLGSHIKKKHPNLHAKLRGTDPCYKSQPYYEKLRSSDLSLKDVPVKGNHKKNNMPQEVPPAEQQQHEEEKKIKLANGGPPHARHFSFQGIDCEKSKRIFDWADPAQIAVPLLCLTLVMIVLILTVALVMK